MTCVVGIAKDGIVYLGGDGAASTEDWQILPTIRTKVFQCGDILIGSAGNIRVSQLLRHVFEPPPVSEPIEKYMVMHFVPAIKKLLKDDEQKSENLLSDSTLLVGVNGHLFMVCADFDVLEAIEYNAIGLGGDVALGSLYTSQSLDPEERVKIALQAAHANNASVREPFTFISSAVSQPPMKGTK